MATREYQRKAEAKAKKLAANRKIIEKELVTIKEKRPVGRPKLDLDVSQIELYASRDYTAEEIAACMGCDQQTLYNREEFLEAMKRGRAKGNASLRTTLYSMANEDKIPSVAIFLGKARLGLNDGGNLGVEEQKPFKEKVI